MSRLLLLLLASFFAEIQAAGKRIVGGDVADSIEDFPYQVMVLCEQDPLVTICGGALVTKNKIVTAAHCVKNCETENLKVIAGAFKPDAIHKHEVKGSYPHPKFSYRKFGDDIAVLCLENTLKEGDRIRHINVAKKPVRKNTKAVVSGWGMTEDSALSQELRYADVTVIEGSKCKAENPLFDDTQICTDSDGAGPCKGDSGGPLVANKELIGVVSYGNKDCQAKFVKEHEKAQKVHRVFEDVADSYDIMNDAMSVGIHRIWKDVFMQRLNPTRNTKLLDVAGGTGDIAFRFLDYLKTTNNEQDCHVKVCDINSHMLDVGRVRSERLGYNPALISWQVGDAEKLPFEDDYFTAYTIAFGIRNVTHIDKALEEAYRVLRPGGRFLCLEFSQLENSAAQWLYDLYSFQLIPVMGHLIAGQWQPYQYLVESIRQFPNQEMYKNMIEKAGFRQVTYENLTLGIVAIHSGFKL